MTEERIDHSKRVKLKTFPHIRFLVYESSVEPNTWVIKLLSRVTCVKPGNLIDVGSDLRVWREEELTSEELTQHVKDLFLEHMRHELEEGLLIDGKPPFNPHPAWPVGGETP